MDYRQGCCHAANTDVQIRRQTGEQFNILCARNNGRRDRIQTCRNRFAAEQDAVKPITVHITRDQGLQSLPDRQRRPAANQRQTIAHTEFHTTGANGLA